MVQINNTLDLIGFKDLDVKESTLEENDKEIHIYIRLNIQECECPKCGTYNRTLHSVRERVIFHRHFVGKKCYIHYQKNRMKCCSCKNTYYEPNPFAKMQERISDETIFFVLNELKSNQSFSDVANKAGLSTTEVIRIFDKHVDMSREKLPTILGIDEFKNLSTGRGKYACILTSINEGSFVDVLEDRTIETLSRYFSIIDR